MFFRSHRGQWLINELVLSLVSQQLWYSVQHQWAAEKCFWRLFWFTSNREIVTVEKLGGVWWGNLGNSSQEGCPTRTAKLLNLSISSWWRKHDEYAQIMILKSEDNTVVHRNENTSSRYCHHIFFIPWGFYKTRQQSWHNTICWAFDKLVKIKPGNVSKLWNWLQLFESQTRLEFYFPFNGLSEMVLPKLRHFQLSSWCWWWWWWRWWWWWWWWWWWCRASKLLSFCKHIAH